MDKRNTPDPRLYLSRLDYDESLKSNSVEKHDFILGLWCCRDFRGVQKGKLLPYKNNKASKMLTANRSVDQAFIKLNQSLSSGLNEIHQSTYDSKYWVILYGYWLRQFLDILYDRYKIIEEAKKTIGTEPVDVCLPDQMDHQASFDTDDFSVGVFTDYFNHCIFGDIINYLGYFNIMNRSLKKECSSKLGRKSTFKLLKKLVFEISTFLVRLNKVIIIRSYFSKTLISKLSLRFFSPPLLGTSIYKNHTESDQLRKILKLQIPSNSSEFEKLAATLIAKYIPKIFVEHHKDLVLKGERTRPKKAKVFLTANAFAAQELYKYWVAKSRYDGKSVNIIVQHGANYGHSTIMSEEQYERLTSDIYVTSGWDDNRKPSVKPFVASSFLGGIGDYSSREATYCPRGNIVWVLCSLPRYQYTQWSAPQGPDFVTYLDNQCSFLGSLNTRVKDALICRAYQYDYGWDDISYLKRYGGNFRLANPRKSLRNLMKSARAMVFTYDSTSMMESMALNIPTFCFWDPKRWPWRDCSVNLLNEMKLANIFFENPEELALYLNNNANLFNWWKSSYVQEVRRKFCEQYASTSSNEYKSWSELIRSLI